MNRSARKLLLRSGVLLTLMCSGAMAQKTVVPFNEEERVVVKISNKSMNRLSVEGDRIQEVIGLNEAISVEKDANHGHMFLKVPEGSADKIEITVITEGGVVQDLTLQPVDKSSTTLVLKSGDAPSEGKRSRSSSAGKDGFQNPEPLIPATHFSNTAYQDTLIELMRVLFLGSFEDGGATPSDRCGPGGIGISFLRGFNKGEYLGEVFELSNTSKDSVDIQERDFYRVGDMAVAVEQKSLKPGQKTKLYIIRRGS